MTLGENLEVINLRAIAGEYDSQARHIDISKLPVLLENQQKGGYRVYLDPVGPGRRRGAVLQPELREGPRDRQVAQQPRVPDRAVARASTAPRSTRPSCSVSARPGRRRPASGRSTSRARSSRRCTPRYDVKKANEMLDKLGLDQEGRRGVPAAGRRQGPAAGSPLTTYLGFLPFTQIAEMIVEHWKKIGIRGEVQEMERGLATARLRANEHQIYFETQWGADNMYGHTPLYLPRRRRRARWGRSTARGTRARGPGQDAAGAHARADGQVPQVVQREGRRSGSRLAKEVWKIALDELWMIPRRRRTHPPRRACG